MREIELPEGPRVETGAIRFSRDWPGLFIRGDNAFYLATLIECIIENKSPIMVEIAKDALASLSKIIREEVVQK